MFRRRGTPGSSRSASPAVSDHENDEDGISVISMNDENPHPLSPEIDVYEEDEDVDPRNLNEDAALNPNIHFRYTSRHPIGSILLSLANESMKLGEKIGHRSTDISVQELSTAFYNWQLNEKRKIRSQIKKKTDGLEDTLLEREMYSHTINQSIEAPTNFSPVPTLLTARQRADCLKLLPQGSNKFSGDKRYNVVEFLQNLKALQKQLNLSRDEFNEAMLASTTGNAYSLLTSWVENEESPSTIFHNLLIHYDTRLQPEEARIKLSTYKARKTQKLGEVEAEIMELATRAASSIQAGPGRAANYNMEVIQGLIRALPPASASIVRYQNSEKSAKYGRMLTAAELSKILNIYRPTIDDDIKQNGVDARTINKRFIPRNKNYGAKKYSTYHITKIAPQTYGPQAPVMVPGRQFHQINQVSQNNKPVALGGNYPFNNGTKNMQGNGMQKNWSSRSGTNNNNNRNKRNSGYREGRTINKYVPRRQFNNNNRRQQPNNDYCSLCGNRDHRATDSCKFMVSDSGVRIPIMPTKTTCTKCPAFVNPRLSHPENLCPYRKSGPWGKQ
jgi:hypothetical protein